MFYYYTGWSNLAFIMSVGVMGGFTVMGALNLFQGNFAAAALFYVIVFTLQFISGWLQSRAHKRAHRELKGE